MFESGPEYLEGGHERIRSAIGNHATTRPGWDREVGEVYDANDFASDPRVVGYVEARQLPDALSDDRARAGDLHSGHGFGACVVELDAKRRESRGQRWDLGGDLQPLAEEPTRLHIEAFLGRAACEPISDDERDLAREQLAPQLRSEIRGEACARESPERRVVKIEDDGLGECLCSIKARGDLDDASTGFVLDEAERTRLRAPDTRAKLETSADGPESEETDAVFTGDEPMKPRATFALSGSDSSALKK